jgi:hypothetical protein
MKSIVILVKTSIYIRNGKQRHNTSCYDFQIIGEQPLTNEQFKLKTWNQGREWSEKRIDLVRFKQWVSGLQGSVL